MILLREIDKPKTLGEKVAKYLARPPQPVLRFYGDSSIEVTDNKRHILFAVRNGLPLPLLYGIYVEVKYDEAIDYIEKTDHIGPFSIDNWRLTLDTIEPAQLKLIVGLVPFEIKTDTMLMSI